MPESLIKIRITKYINKTISNHNILSAISYVYKIEIEIEIIKQNSLRDSSNKNHWHPSQINAYNDTNTSTNIQTPTSITRDIAEHVVKTLSESLTLTNPIWVDKQHQHTHTIKLRSVGLGDSHRQDSDRIRHHLIGASIPLFIRPSVHMWSTCHRQYRNNWVWDLSHRRLHTTHHPPLVNSSLVSMTNISPTINGHHLLTEDVKTDSLCPYLHWKF